VKIAQPEVNQRGTLLFANACAAHFFERRGPPSEAEGASERGGIGRASDRAEPDGAARSPPTGGLARSKVIKLSLYAESAAKICVKFEKWACGKGQNVNSCERIQLQPASHSQPTTTSANLYCICDFVFFFVLEMIRNENFKNENSNGN